MTCLACLIVDKIADKIGSVPTRAAFGAAFVSGYCAGTYTSEGVRASLCEVHRAHLAIYEIGFLRSHQGREPREKVVH